MKKRIKAIVIPKPDKILGAYMIFPITPFGQISVDSSLFGKDFCIQEIILVCKVADKKFSGF